MKINRSKKIMIEEVLALYGKPLESVCVKLREGGFGIEKSDVMRAAYELPERDVGPGGLKVMLELEASLNDRFPGIRYRMRALLINRITESLRPSLH